MVSFDGIRVEQDPGQISLPKTDQKLSEETIWDHLFSLLVAHFLRDSCPAPARFSQPESIVNNDIEFRKETGT